MSLVMGWLGRSRLRARPASEARRLVYPLGTLIVGLICFVGFASVAIHTNVFPNKTVTWWTTTGFVGFALVGLFVMSQYFVEKYEVSEEGLSGRNAFGIRKRSEWSDLRAVRYAAGMKWFRLETRSGSVVRISAGFMGLPEFARLLLQNAAEGTIDAKTMDVLRATAGGQPPPVWK